MILGPILHHIFAALRWLGEICSPQWLDRRRVLVLDIYSFVLFGIRMKSGCGFFMGSSSSLGRVLYPHLPPTGGIVSSLRCFFVGGLEGRRFQYHYIQLELDRIGLD